MLKHSVDGFSRSWSVKSRQGASYTGGAMCVVSPTLVACLCSERVSLLDTATGLVRAVIPAPEFGVAHEPVVNFSVSRDGRFLVTFGRALLVRVWSLEGVVEEEGGGGGSPAPPPVCLRQWKAHKTPVQVSTMDPSGALVATGGSDRVVFVWDVDGGFATHSFKGGHEGLITALAFQPHPVSAQRLLSGGADGKVCLWDLLTQSCVATLNEHTAAVTTLLFSPTQGGHTLVSGARDRILNVWDLREAGVTGGKPHKASTPVYESVEGGVVLPTSVPIPVPGWEEGGSSGSSTSGSSGSGSGVRFAVALAGDRGMLRVWGVNTGVGASSGTGSGSGSGGKRARVTCLASTNAQALSLREGKGSEAWWKGGDASAIGGPDSLPDPDAQLPLSHQFSALLLLPPPPVGVGAGVGEEEERKKEGGKKKRRESSTSASTSTSLPRLLLATHDQTLNCLTLPSLVVEKSIAGHNDAFTHSAYIPTPPSSPHRLLAVSTNSEQVRLINTHTLDTRFLDGHKGVVLAVAPSPDGNLIASASKDSTVRVWDVTTGVCVAICEGHTESVTAVALPSRGASSSTTAVGGGAAGASAPTPWLISASRDRTLKAWNLGPLHQHLPIPRQGGGGGESGGGKVWCGSLAREASHAAALMEKSGGGGAVGGGGGKGSKKQQAPPHTSSSTTTTTTTSQLFSPRTLGTCVAHEKDINTLAVSPNDRVLASGSQDKTVKLWSLPALTPLATLKGHKRGVWCVAFSPSEQVLISASGDGTLRLWSVAASTHYACLRAFEGHDGPVLCAAFLPGGGQVLSGGADGVLKVWALRESECVGSFSAHGDKVWCLSVSGAGGLKDAEVVTGGGDSLLNVWKDTTEDEAAVEVAANEEAVMKNQELMEAMAGRKYAKVLALTLELDQPGRCGEVLSELLEVGPLPKTAGMASKKVAALYRESMVKEVGDMAAFSVGMEGKGTSSSSSSSSSVSLLPEGLNAEGVSLFTGLLPTLSPPQLVRLLTYIREWNTRNKFGLLAQRLLHLFLRTFSREEMEGLFASAREESSRVSSRTIPGVGAVVVRGVKGGEDRALALEESLAPLPHLVGKQAAEEYEREEGALLPPPPKSSASARAELRSFIAAALPYSERHFERIDKLVQGAHFVDYLLQSTGTLSNTPEELRALMGESGRTGAAATRAYQGMDSDGDDDDDEDEDEGEEEEEGRGGSGGWSSALRR